MYLMGIDVGTSSCKIAVFDLEGNMHTHAAQEYSLNYPSSGEMELDAEEVWIAVGKCIKLCGCMFDLKMVNAIAVSSQAEAIIPIDRRGQALCHTPVTFDYRNENEYQWFLNHIDPIRILKITGAPPHPMFSATKILWLKNNRPKIYNTAWKLLCFSDFIAFRLGAKPCMDYSLASRTQLFDISLKKWSREILDKCGILEKKLPKVVASGTVIGSISPENAMQFSFSENCKIVSGGHDQLCCSLGTGVLQEGKLMDSLGTTESMVCVGDKFTFSSNRLKNKIACSIYPVNNLYAYMTFLTNSGSLLRWLKNDIFCSTDENFYFHMDKNIEKNYQYPCNVMVLPYFSGAGTPSLDYHAKGLISGLTLDTKRSQIYQAMIEATCMEERVNLANMEEAGIKIEELRCIGGGARSDIWLRIKADITGRKVESMEINNEGGCLGAAILAGLGIGAFQNAAEAVERFVKVGRTYLPDSEMHRRYGKKYQDYIMMCQKYNPKRP